MGQLSIWEHGVWSTSPLLSLEERESNAMWCFM